MNLLRKLLARRNPARELSLIGHAKHRKSVAAVCRQIREELGLPADARLGR